MVKQGVFRTIEVFIAIFITFIFLTFFIPQREPDSQTPANVLAPLSENEAFRNCIIQKNSTCYTQIVRNALPGQYSYAINLSEDPHATTAGLPDKRVFSNSIFVAGNTTNKTRTIVRLHFWT